MFARTFGLCVAFVAAVALLAASSAASARAHGGAMIDVSTRAAVVDYLRSIHIDPRGVVIERGIRNYAGANCPGRRWTCTTAAHPVVQVASAGGRNLFRCSAASCTVVQVAAPTVTAANKAACIRTDGRTQKCTIVQSSSSANNKAVVYESISTASGLTQNATSTATITQKATGTSNANEACVYQAIDLDGSGTMNGNTVKLTQSAYQTVTIKQDSASGGNSAAESATPDGQCTGGSITQRQTLSSNITAPKAITQNQNAADGGANITIDIEQNQNTGFLGTAYGQNSAIFDQYNSLTAVANGPAGPVSQTQSSLTGGLLGTVNQDSRDLSTATTTQTEIQCEDAAKAGLTACDVSDPDASEAPDSLTQTQFGPVGKGTGMNKGVGMIVRKGVGTATQTGNSADTFDINQSSTQDNDQGAGSSQTNYLEGDCSTDGDCTIVQNTDIDGQQSSNTASGQDLVLTTDCTGSDCTTSGGGE